MLSFFKKLFGNGSEDRKEKEKEEATTVLCGMTKNKAPSLFASPFYPTCSHSHPPHFLITNMDLILHTELTKLNSFSQSRKSKTFSLTLLELECV